jgi:hypothetical protein
MTEHEFVQLLMYGSCHDAPACRLEEPNAAEKVASAMSEKCILQM